MAHWSGKNRTNGTSTQSGAGRRGRREAGRRDFEDGCPGRRSTRPAVRDNNSLDLAGKDEEAGMRQMTVAGMAAIAVLAASAGLAGCASESSSSSAASGTSSSASAAAASCSNSAIQGQLYAKGHLTVATDK